MEAAVQMPRLSQDRGWSHEAAKRIGPVWDGVLSEIDENVRVRRAQSSSLTATAVAEFAAIDLDQLESGRLCEDRGAISGRRVNDNDLIGREVLPADAIEQSRQFRAAL